MEDTQAFTQLISNLFVGLILLAFGIAIYFDRKKKKKQNVHKVFKVK